MNFENFKYKYLKDLPFNESDLNLEELKQEFINDLTNNEKYKPFFDQYDPEHKTAFILRYAEIKEHLIKCYKVYSEIGEPIADLELKDDAIERFNWIKQKKLWDIQLLWRAEKIKINEVELTHDFWFWENHIDECPFISMVTQEEVDLLKEYLRETYLYKINGWDEVNHWQDYDGNLMKDKTGEYLYYPDLYDYFDNHFNTEHFLDLPDIRGEKEDFYVTKSMKIIKEKKEIEMIKNPPPPYFPKPAEPYLSHNYEMEFKYSRLVEKDSHFLELFRLWHENIQENVDKEAHAHKNNIWYKDDINNCLEILKEADTPVYMEPNADWREELVDCSQKYLIEKMIEDIDIVYEEYKMLKEMGITSGKSIDELMIEIKTGILRDHFVPLILNGRELSGEPRDFNF